METNSGFSILWIFLSFLLQFGLSQKNSVINWTETTQDNGTWTWANDCDLGENVFTYSNMPREYSGRECWATEYCTYFVWSKYIYRGGTCWLKYGLIPEPTVRTDYEHMCGFIPSRKMKADNVYSPSWNWTDSAIGESKAKARWANNCDMAGNNFLCSPNHRADNCMKDCLGNELCTHFTWFTRDRDGGTCCLKHGSVPATPTLTTRVYDQFVCGFILRNINEDKSQIESKPKWNWIETTPDETSGRYVRWAENCDFAGNVIGRHFHSQREQCGQECSRNVECTHFAWSNVLGGSCWLKGDPPPNPTWRADSENICGFIRTRTPEVKTEEPERNRDWIIWTVVAILAVVMVASATMFGFRYNRISKLLRGLNTAEIDEFLNGRPELVASNVSKETVGFLPYDKKFEIEIDDVQFDRTDQLGMGNFSVVFRGLVKSRQLFVAIKCPLTTADANQFKAMLLEIKIMVHIGNHENVLALIGACTDSIQQRRVHILLEYAENGSLESYLRHRQPGLGQSEPRKARMNDYTNLKPVYASIGKNDLFRWSYEIAKGMEYLGSKCIVHSDLATRNVLLDSKYTAKISDFGLSRQLYGNLNYVKKTRSQLPWRWMALEALTKLEFSTASDVYSYGVTLWEIFTYGDLPYSNCTWGKDFVDMLRANIHLPKPVDATLEIYGIMSNCWQANKSNRPTFTTLQESFGKLCQTPEQEPLVVAVLQSRCNSNLAECGNSSYLEM